jgi:xanthine dehydrogenase accessory factor
MLNLFSEIDRRLKAGETLVLARIVRQTGSTPRQAGTKQLILADGSLVGTIGGGKLEYEVAARAKEVFATGNSLCLHFQMTGKDAAENEGLCGGLSDVFLERLDPADADLRALFAEVARLSAEDSGAALVTAVQEGTARVGRALLGADGSVLAAMDLPSGLALSGFSALAAERRPRLASLEEAAAAPFFFIEPLAPEPVVYIFGAGHVSTALAPLARMAGFQVAVIDDREEFANNARFPAADLILVCSIEEAFARIRVRPSSFIVIVTRGHLHDRQVLKAALATEPAYIGMIGSRHKRDLVYHSLIEEGVAAERLKGVHSPIGLDIGAESPEEIGISIVAELVQVRAGLEAAKDPLRRKRPSAAAARAEVL